MAYLGASNSTAGIGLEYNSITESVNKYGTLRQMPGNELMEFEDEPQTVVDNVRLNLRNVIRQSKSDN